MILSVVVGVSLVLMIALYSRVVYTLWFQRRKEHHLNIQQKVSVVPGVLVIYYPFLVFKQYVPCTSYFITVMIQFSGPSFQY